MIIDENFINEHLNQKFNWYFNSRFYYGKNDINGISTKIYKDYLIYVKDNFKQDILFDSFYKKYVDYILLKKNGSDYLDVKTFEKHLKDVDIKTYVSMDDNYILYKYICFNEKSTDFI